MSSLQNGRDPHSQQRYNEAPLQTQKLFGPNKLSLAKINFENENKRKENFQNFYKKVKFPIS